MEKILYVEDDLSLIDGLQYTLENSGYSVDNARTVQQALALFKSNLYHLLLLDVTLPDGSGFDICKEVRGSSSVPIIFLTASDQEISVVSCPLFSSLMRDVLGRFEIRAEQEGKVIDLSGSEDASLCSPSASPRRRSEAMTMLHRFIVWPRRYPERRL